MRHRTDEAATESFARTIRHRLSVDTPRAVGHTAAAMSRRRRRRSGHEQAEHTGHSFKNTNRHFSPHLSPCANERLCSSHAGVANAPRRAPMHTSTRCGFTLFCDTTRTSARRSLAEQTCTSSESEMSTTLESVYPIGLPLYDLTLTGILLLACGAVLRLAARPKPKPAKRKQKQKLEVPRHVELPRQRTRTALTRAWDAVRGDRHTAA